MGWMNDLPKSAKAIHCLWLKAKTLGWTHSLRDPTFFLKKPKDLLSTLLCIGIIYNHT